MCTCAPILRYFFNDNMINNFQHFLHLPHITAQSYRRSLAKITRIRWCTCNDDDNDEYDNYTKTCHGISYLPYFFANLVRFIKTHQIPITLLRFQSKHIKISATAAIEPSSQFNKNQFENYYFDVWRQTKHTHTQATKKMQSFFDFDSI